MSYILDALRKADAQRERDASRGIHANPSAPGSGKSSAFGSRAGVWVAVITGLVVAAVAGFYFTRHSNPVAPVVANTSSATPPEVTASSLPPATPVKMLPPQAVANSIAPPAPAPLQFPPRDATNTSLPPMRGMPQANLAPGMSADDRARQAREAAFARAPGGPPPAAVARSATAPQVAQAEPVPAAGLPPDAPKVAISGGVYSPNPAQRMLIVNGQVFNEGSEIAPGLTIDRIEARTAILKFRGARYNVAY